MIIQCLYAMIIYNDCDNEKYYIKLCCYYVVIYHVTTLTMALDVIVVSHIT